MARDEFEPLTDDEIDAIAQGLAGPDGSTPWLALAVSGGVDSMALMQIVAEARARGRFDGGIVVATVDHGLRTGSADEAVFVAAQARLLGLEHVTLVWQGPKPATGIQEAARAARYGLLGELIGARPEWAKALVTAHTLDDQAETVLMRLARGSGVEGLSGMREREVLRLGGADAMPVTVLRPLLGVRKGRLIATMGARGLRWREDPGNGNVVFERVRFRKAMPVLAELGLTAEAIGLSALRLGRVKDELGEATARVRGDRTYVRVSPLGYVDLDAALWRSGKVGAAVAQRVLGGAIRAVGGLERPVSLRALEALADNLGGAMRLGRRFDGVTLGRAKVVQQDGCVRVLREVGRDMAGAMQLEPGCSGIWDNRFEVHVAAGRERGLEVRALGTVGVAMLRKMELIPPAVPAEVLRTVPGFWEGEKLVEVPSIVAVCRGSEGLSRAGADVLLGQGAGAQFIAAVAWERSGGTEDG